MIPGISTACVYPEVTEKGLELIGGFGAQSAEVFFNAPSELEESYLKELRRMADGAGVRILSIHPFTSNIEPLFFFSGYLRRHRDGIELYKRFFHAANLLGADLLVFHGDRREATRPYESYFERFVGLMEAGQRMGVTVAQENVPRCTSWQPRFFEEMAKALPEAKFVLDVKQSLRAGFAPMEMAKAMGTGLVHLHISDHDQTHDCLPVGKGCLDTKKMLEELKRQGFDGGVILEVYRDNYQVYEELGESYQKILEAISEKAL